MSAERPAVGRPVRLLSDSLINKIAAGEVVERPASVVKELVENAVDAGAGRVVVTVRGGGRGLIRVSDDGHGMSRQDAVACVERHATSKLRTDADLFAISSFGFRGEALPSIAEVSSFELRTGEPGAPAGTRVAIDQGVIEAIEDAANPGGTEVTVRRLFVSTPARLKFLKADRTEMGHVTDWVTRLALAHPEIAFRLETDDRTAFDLPASDALLPRVEALLGKATARDLRPVEAEADGLRIEGLVSLPRLSRSSTAGLTLFVNGRFVRDRALTGAVLAAWKDLLPRGRYPVAVLFLDLPPDRVDVNVHPQKLEVRFRDGRGVWRFVTNALGAALRGLGGALPESVQEQAGLFPSAPRPYSADLRRVAAGPARASSLPGGRPIRQWSPEQAAAVLDRAVPRPVLTAAEPSIGATEHPTDGSLSLVGWLDDGVLLARQGRDLLVVDALAARARLLHARLVAATGEAPIAARRLLVPGLIDTKAESVRRLEAAGPVLATMGVDAGAFGAETAALHAMCPELDSSRATEVLGAILDALAATGGGTSERLAAVLCAFVAPGPSRPSNHEIAQLLAGLAEAPPPPSGMAHGQVRVPRGTLAAWIERGQL